MAIIDDDSARERRRTLALLRQPERGGYLPRRQLAFNLATLDLYDGDGVAAWERLQRVWGWQASSTSMKIEPARIVYRDLCGRAAIAAMLDERGRGRSLRRAALRAIRDLAGEVADWAHGHAHLLRAGLQAMEGASAAALASYTAAEEVFVRTDMLLMACAARDRRGILLGGVYLFRYLTRRD